MNNFIELALAEKIINLASKDVSSKNYVTLDFINGNIEENNAFSGFHIIKEIMNEGLSPILPLEYQNKKGLLIEHVFENFNDSRILLFFINKLTKEDVKKLNTKIVNNLYNCSDSNQEIMEKLFDLGFDFNQGEFNEVEKALNQNLSFFELCLIHKKDFKFNYKYEDNLTLKELLSEDIETLKESRNDYSSAIKSGESLLVFLEKVEEQEKLKDNLELNLKNNKESTNKIKI